MVNVALTAYTPPSVRTHIERHSESMERERNNKPNGIETVMALLDVDREI